LGLSAIVVASAHGARVLAVDINEAALDKARELGAEVLIDAGSVENVPGLIREATGGGADVSLDTLGSPVTASNSILGLRKRGRHVQVGLLNDGPTPLPMDAVIARELEVVGSHGMAAHDYPQLLALIESGRIDPGALVEREISLDEVPAALAAMREFAGSGVTVAIRF
jgi:alcohol dehydrogenase